MSLILEDLASGYNLRQINDNFQRIENFLNDEIDWKLARFDIETFLKMEDRKFIEHWNRDLFYEMLKKLKVILN